MNTEKLREILETQLTYNDKIISSHLQQIESLEVNIKNTPQKRSQPYTSVCNAAYVSTVDWSIGKIQHLKEAISTLHVRNAQIRQAMLMQPVPVESKPVLENYSPYSIPNTDIVEKFRRLSFSELRYKKGYFDDDFTEAAFEELKARLLEIQYPELRKREWDFGVTLTETHGCFFGHCILRYGWDAANVNTDPTNVKWEFRNEFRLNNNILDYLFFPIEDMNDKNSWLPTTARPLDLLVHVMIYLVTGQKFSHPIYEITESSSLAKQATATMIETANTQLVQLFDTHKE